MDTLLQAQDRCQPILLECPNELDYLTVLYPGSFVDIRPESRLPYSEVRKN